MQRRPELRGHRSAEHVQDLVTPVAEPAQPLRRHPHLGWLVVGQLRRHDLVDREVEPRVHLAAVDNDGVGLGVELRMGGADQQRALVRVGGIEPLRALVRVVDRRDRERQPPVTLVGHAYCGGGVPRSSSTRG
jgi:hypothetical protein